MATKSLCAVPDCGKAAMRRDWCSLHYRRWLKHGDPVAGRVLNGEPQRFLHDVVFAYDGAECLIWPYSKQADGRGQIYYEGRMQKVHRIVCEYDKGPSPEPDLDAAHSCGKGHLVCVTKGHLSWKTHADNMAEMVEHGTSPKGERHGMVKLTEAEVLEIRSLKGKALQREIAEQFGVTRTLISLIHSGKSWGWL